MTSHATLVGLFDENWETRHVGKGPQALSDLPICGMLDVAGTGIV